MSKSIGILTAGGDTPGINAAIRAIGKSAMGEHGYEVIGFMDGFRGLVQDRYLRLERDALTNIISVGGTLLGTSRDRPHKMVVGSKIVDMTELAVENYRKHHLEALICLGGGGTQKNAFRLAEKGLNIITLPKTIDNDVEETDVTFGFDTATGIAVEAMDRLHTTAHSHHRVIVVETMGHRVGWLALCAGAASGADVILIPEIPYDVEVIAESVLQRSRSGKNFSIIAIAEGALSREQAEKQVEKAGKVKNGENGSPALRRKESLGENEGRSMRLANTLEDMTGLESRVTILGHVQRGGSPSAADRLLSTVMGTTAVQLVEKGQFGVMVAYRGQEATPVPLEEVIGRRKFVPLDHPIIESARRLGTCFGDG